MGRLTEGNVPMLDTSDSGNGIGHGSPADDDLRSRIEARYGALARDVIERDGPPSCCGESLHVLHDDPITAELYDEHQASVLPEAAVAASLGCGNPTALIELTEGQVVLDLGSGGGIDVLLSARRVGPTGKAYGLDMTDDMLELSRRNQQDAGVDNAEFMKGTIEDIPLPDGSVDVIISNCVINLSVDKPRVFREAFRVLRSGGRFAVSDIVIRGELDEEIQRSVEAWLGCVAGAIEEGDYRDGLRAVGFVDIEIEPTRIYSADDARQFLDGDTLSERIVRAAEGHVMSAFVRATKP